MRDLTAANRAGAERIAAAASPPRKSGRLAASIQVTGAGPTEATVGSGLIYAPVIEYGWRAHGIEGRHFLASAADGQTTAVVDGYYRAVDGALAHVKGI